MVGERDSKLPLFASIAVLAIPAVIYVMGYIYWDSYFKHFGVELAKVNLPVYKVMVAATPAVYVIILASILIYFASKDITRSNSGYKLPKVKVVFTGGLICIVCGLTLLRQPIDLWIKAALLLVGAGFVLWSFEKTAKRDCEFGWRVVAIIIVLVPLVVFCLLKLLSEAKARNQADKLLKESYEKCSSVAFHFSPDAGSYLPDSLILIASSESNYFVFSRPDTADGKPRRVFAVKKTPYRTLKFDLLKCMNPLNTKGLLNLAHRIKGI